jgi:hypothetical protein
VDIFDLELLALLSFDFEQLLDSLVVIGPGQRNELPEQPFKAVDRIIHFVKSGMARRRIGPQAPDEIEMRA